MLTRTEHPWNARCSKMAKEKLRPLPVIEGGVEDISIKSLRSVWRAGRDAVRRLGSAAPRDVQRVWQAAMWVAYRCTDYRAADVARAFDRTEAGCMSAVLAANRRIEDGDLATRTDVDRILRFIDVGFIPREDDESRAMEAEEGSADPVVAKIRYWRDKGATVKSIARWEGLDPAYVARVVGVQWGRVEP